MKKLILVPLSIFISLILAQAQGGELKGTVTDNTKKLIPFANIALYRGTQLVTGGVANINGDYSIKPITPGIYDVEMSAIGYTKKRFTNIHINGGKTEFLNGFLDHGEIIVCFLDYYSPVIQKDQTEQGSFWSRRDISGSPGRDIMDLSHPD